MSSIARHLPPLPEGHPLGYRIPRPVILDTHLRLPPTCKLLKNYKSGRGRRPWVVCARRTALCDVADNEAFAKRAAALQNAGARIVEVDADEATGAIAITALLSTLHELGVRSVMVEGGARVIRAFLSAAAAAAHRSAVSGSGDTDTKKEKAVDALVVTVAPTLVGAAGVGYGTELLADAVRVPNRSCAAPPIATDISRSRRSYRRFSTSGPRRSGLTP
ncbi:hypothetical protein TRAPUB_4722 [Trametes pubescens]|uniref:2,5-diamino-6-ribosylamino-4(3H)-pyrimidinone 5'-phosphate reductase n=1 Tax=Trametes pubescens TaxID=154538 RepID=A0A1M2VA63_TRAPU|nr:hypothetical protein TRAPUB_4722 [Trametes pubescens]